MPVTRTNSAFASPDRWLALSVVALATFLVTMDYGLLSISLPVIVNDFKADISLAGWLFLVYALVTASLYLPCGRLSDLIGRKKVFMIGFLIYAISTLVAAVSVNGGQLIVVRAAQGVGSALIMVNGFAFFAGGARTSDGNCRWNGIGAGLHVGACSRWNAYPSIRLALDLLSHGRDELGRLLCGAALYSGR